LLLVGAGAALAGFAVQGLFDNTATMATITLLVILILIIACAPHQSLLAVARPTTWRLRTAALVILGLALLGTGVWSNVAYGRYVDGLLAGFSGLTKPADAAHRVESAIALDPDIPVYHVYRGLFWSWAARDGGTVDSQVQFDRRSAIQAYERVTQLEPYYAPAWLNLAVLYYADGAWEKARAAAARAEGLAPNDAHFAYNAGAVYEKTGDLDAANRAYQAAARLAVSWAIYPIPNSSLIWRSHAREPRLIAAMPSESRAVYLFINDVTEDARVFWAEGRAQATDARTRHAVSAVLAAATGETAVAQAELEALVGVVAKPDEDVLVSVVRGWLAWSAADQDGVRAALAEAEARDRRFANVTYLDFAVGPFTYSGYLRVSSPPYFVPDVFVARLDPVTAGLLRYLQTKRFTRP
jgi:tetratricopeptide (TPR) repeat protein